MGSTPDDEKLALRITLCRSWMDMGGSSSFALSPVARGQLKLHVWPGQPVAVRTFPGEAVGRVVAPETSNPCSSRTALGGRAGPAEPTVATPRVGSAGMATGRADPRLLHYARWYPRQRRRRPMSRQRLCQGVLPSLRRPQGEGPGEEVVKSDAHVVAMF